MAALAAAPLTDKSWLLLEPLVRLMRGNDRFIASTAAGAARKIAEDLRAPVLELNEEGRVTLAPVAEKLADLARDSRLSLDIRIKAVLTLAQMLEVTDPPKRSMSLLLGSSEPRLREAAVELFASNGKPELLARLVAEDPVISVARSAAVALCARVPLTGRDSTLKTLKEAGALPRLFRLTESLDARDDQLVDMARCLRRSPSKEGRQAYRQLRRRSARMRRLLRRMR
jgi:hypothetical protein